MSQSADYRSKRPDRRLSPDPGPPQNRSQNRTPRSAQAPGRTPRRQHQARKRTQPLQTGGGAHRKISAMNHDEMFPRCSLVSPVVNFVSAVASAAPEPLLEPRRLAIMKTPIEGT